jgi:hypothetical protein
MNQKRYFLTNRRAGQKRAAKTLASPGPMSKLPRLAPGREHQDFRSLRNLRFSHFFRNLSLFSKMDFFAIFHPFHLSAAPFSSFASSASFA